MLKINLKTKDITSKGYAVSKIIKNKKNKDYSLEVIFTKGKTEVILMDVDRINIYSTSANIYYKNGDSQYINLDNITTIN